MAFLQDSGPQNHHQSRFSSIKFLCANVSGVSQFFPAPFSLTVPDEDSSISDFCLLMYDRRLVAGRPLEVKSLRDAERNCFPRHHYPQQRQNHTATFGKKLLYYTKVYSSGSVAPILLSGELDTDRNTDGRRKSRLTLCIHHSQLSLPWTYIHIFEPLKHHRITLYPLSFSIQHFVPPSRLRLCHKITLFLTNSNVPRHDALHCCRLCFNQYVRRIDLCCNR